MSKFLRLSILVTALLISMGCLLTDCFGPNPAPTPTADPNSIIGTPTLVSLVVQPQPATYTAVGQAIAYSYLVTNNGTTPLAGPASITDDKGIVATCPDLNTVGNQNANLDNAETITCTGSYTTTQADISNLSLTNNATASVGGQTSNSVATTIQAQLNKFLSLSVSANPTSYNAAGQNITYTYVITNTNPTTLGPAQFIVKDDRIPTLINCGADTTTLATNQTVSCTGVYTTTAADVSATQITNTVTATGAGAMTIQPVTGMVINSTIAVVTPVSTYVPGTTIQHDVVTGEWLLQISRCYGANFKAVRNANLNIKDPSLIYPVDTVIVPNVGSDGIAYGPPCIVFHTVVSGDSWESIANQYNADIEVLKEANLDKTVTPGVVIKVPKNSKQSGSTPVPPPTAIPPTAIPPTAIPPTAIPPTVRPPIRLTIQPGTPLTQTGTIGTPDTIRYVFTGATGQILTVRVTVPTNDLGLAIYAPNGAALKPLDLNTSWSGTLAANGDYSIDIVSTLGSTNKTYTLEVTLTNPTVTSPTVRVADINPGPADSNPSYLATFGSQVYFQANANDGVGAELWRYDQGLNAVSRVADINPGSGGSEPAYLAVYADNLYFRANGNDGAGVELWRLNANGATGRVTDLYTGPESSNPMYMTVFNNNLFFSANGNDGTGVELWRYDGTVSTRAADINPGSGNSNPAYLAVFNNALYFSATSNDGAGTELWKFDGTAASLVADINVGVGNSNPAFLSVYNGVLYFSANANDGTGTELWKFDGTTATRAADINPGAADSAPTYMTVFNNALYFSAIGDSSGFELWKFDGTTPSRVADINPAGNSNPSYLAVYNNALYFQANANDGAGAELWKFTGP